MKFSYCFFCSFLFLMTQTGISQTSIDTLPDYLFLENRLRDCHESINFMRFYIEPSGQYRKSHSNNRNGISYQISCNLRFEKNEKKIRDLHRFYIDLSCIRSMDTDSFLYLFATSKIHKRLLKRIHKVRVNDTLTINCKIENTDGFKLYIVNRKISGAEWVPDRYSYGTKPDYIPIMISGHDTLPNKYHLHNRVSDCTSAYKFMESVIKKRPEDVITPFPNDRYERKNIIVEIYAERSDYPTNEYPSSNKYRDFYIDIKCLKNEPIEIILFLFLSNEQVEETTYKIDQLKGTGYTLVLKIEIKYIGRLDIQIENGNIVGLGWPFSKDSH